MILPHALYFLSQGSTENEYGVQPEQIWRLAPDGVTLTEITHEMFDIKEFDVSLTSGRLAYVTDQRASNQLLLMQVDGNERQVIVDNGPDDGWGLNAVGSPRWSPNGEFLAFHHSGINFYRVGNGQAVKIVEDHVEEPGSADNISYSPELWSPDGKHILVIQEGWEGGQWMLYSPEGKALTSLNSSYGYNESAAWSTDSKWVIFTSSTLMGDGCVDLLQFNVLAQATSTVVACQFSTEGYSNAGWPLWTLSGDLLYFYNHAGSNEGYYSGQLPAWTITRAALDGLAPPILLRSGLPVEIAEVLWDRDGTLAVVSLNRFSSGPLALVPTDGSQPVQFVAPGGRNLRWGP